MSKYYRCLISRSLSFQRNFTAIFIVISLLLTACGGNGSTSDSDTDALKARQVVVSDVDMNIDEGTLTIYGESFNEGEWVAAEVSLNDSLLTVLQQSANEIIAELPDTLILESAYLLTVKTGDNVEDIDAYALIPVGTDASGLFNQLLVLLPKTVGEPGQKKLIIAGYNFDNGLWPPEVTLNNTPLVMDFDQSSSEMLVLYVTEEMVEIIANAPAGNILVVKTGTTSDQHDAYVFLGSDDEILPSLVGVLPGSQIPDLACKRNDLAKVLTTGEHCCTTAGQNLCWSTGPIREDTKNFLFNSDEIPRYFELTNDYVIPIATYFTDPPPVSFPSFWRVIGDGDPDTKREKLRPLVDELPYFNNEIQELINMRKWDFVDYSEGQLIIKKGYRWDGASVGWDRKYYDDRLLRTYLLNMRSSLVHDVFYDLIRLEVLNSDTTDNLPSKGGTNDYRNVADILFYLTAKEDGHKDDGFRSCALCFKKGKLKTFFKTLRRLGQTKARIHSEKNAAWRFHTQADASVSATGVEMNIDEVGEKSLVLSCSESSDEIVLDAGNSRPIARVPMMGNYESNLNLHDTSWEWSLSGELVSQGVHEFPTGNLFMEPDKFKTVLTMDDLLGLGLMPGNNYSFALNVDKGKNTSEAFFETVDEIKFRVEADNEAPVITGISDPIIAWPPNHKYRTFLISDFVSAVADNCGTITVDDLVITQVTSDEAENSCGDGHTQSDILIAEDRKSVDLRIERKRSYNDNGRVYTIYIQAADRSGNTVTVPFYVHVPSHMYKTAIDDGSAYAVSG